MGNKLKDIAKLILAAMLGGAMTFGLVSWIGTGEKTVTVEHITEGSDFVKTASLVENEIGFPDFTNVAENVTPSVVHIKSVVVQQSARSSMPPQMQVPDPFRDFFGGEDPFRQFFHFQPGQRGPQTRMGSGSGVVVSEEGYIVTNNHVVANADEIEVTFSDNKTVKATVVGTDPSTDLALIQVESNNLAPIRIANSDEVRVGQWVLAVGNPYNLESTVTAGIVSAKARNINILKDQSAVESFIQTDAAVNPGNSGGALVDVYGNLVGINTAIASPTGSYAGYSFAVPSNMVIKVMNDLMEYGVVQRGFLGIMIRDVNSELALEHDLDISEGVYVDSLTENSAAKAGGVKVGDVVTKVAGIPVKSSPELQELVARHRPGDDLRLTVYRNGKEKNLTVTLKNKEGNTGTVTKSKDEVLAPLGAEFEEIPVKEAKQLDLSGGVKVTRLLPGKLRKNTGMREGFIITKVDGKKVRTVKDLSEALEGRKGGVMIEGCYPDVPGTHYYAFGM